MHQPNFKIVFLSLSTLIFLQGCTVYKAVNVSKDEASKTDHKVRIEKKDGKKEKYFQVVLLKDGQ